MAKPLDSGTLLFAALLAAAGCGTGQMLQGTTVPDTPVNRQILETIDSYRDRLMARNVEGLLVLASQQYFEDSGTPRADDDYGFEGLKDVLTGKMIRLKNLRYEIRYRNVRLIGDRAEVDVFIDGSYEVGSAEVGDRYRRVSDQHRFVLHRGKDEKWKFLSGM